VQSEATVVPGVRERAVRFASGGGTLAGVLSLPGSPRERGVVILHGWGTYRSGPHDMLVKLARELASHGTPVLRFDFRGRGESTGRVLDTDLDMMIDDAARAAELLREETGAREVDGVGLCSGANVALGAAAHTGAFGKVAALSVMPFQSHTTGAQRLRRTRGKLGELVAKALRPSTWWRLVTGRVRVFRVLGGLFGGGGGKTKTASGETRNLKDSSHDLMGELAQFEGGLLFVWGGADAEGMGAKSHFEDFAREHALDAEFKVVEGSNHNFYSLEWEREVFDLVTGYLTEGEKP
jgi:pimeloyl-ACP methyl ester carboxylesterase